MTDREKKITEIREALEKATPGPWEIVDIGGIEIAKDYKYKDGKHIAYWIAEMYQDEDIDEDQVYADAHLIANAPEWLRFLLSELERKDEVIEEQKRELFYKSKEITELREKSWQDQQWFKQASANITEMQKELDREREENRKLREERDKLIEVLREVVKFDYHTNPDIHYKRLARDILKEIGVTVEPDRLHDARVKIAKARFSPERLADESAVYGIDCRSGRCEG